MANITSYKDLIVWQKSILLVKNVYLVTESFPKSELFSLTSQMRRAAISIPSNIAEGFGRTTAKEHAQFINIAYGSVLELETQVVISKELKFTKQNTKELDSNLIEVAKMLNAIKMKNKLPGY